MANLIDGKLSKGSEVINGTDADDYIRPLGGSDFIDGKKGFDTVYVYWPSSKFKVTTIQGTTYLDAISGASSSDKVVLRNVEQVEFSDKTLSLEIADAYVNTVGSDSFDGGPGVDTMVYKGASTDYALKSKSSGLDVTRLDYTEGSDYLQGMERIQFNDKSVAFDIDGRAGIAAKTLSLVFGKEAVGVPAYVGICLDFLDNKSYSASQLMNEALKIRLGTKASDAGQVVDFLYERLMGTLPTPEAKSLYVGWIQNQTYSIEGLAVYASNLSLNPVASDLVGLVTTGLFYIPVSTNG